MSLHSRRQMVRPTTNRWKRWHRHHSVHFVKILIRNILCCWVVAAFFAPVASAAVAYSFPSYGPTVPGNRACIRGGVACAPSEAPLSVKRAIWAGNQLRSKPYRFGGGHRSFHDSGYDCSGTVSYALAGAGLVRIPLNSSEFRRYGSQGRGKWITIYARSGHAFAVIAGLRLDTTAWNSSRVWAPRWQTIPRAPAGFEARHPVGL